MSLQFKNGVQQGKAMLQHEVTANIASSCSVNRLLDLLWISCLRSNIDD